MTPWLALASWSLLYMALRVVCCAGVSWLEDIGRSLPRWPEDGT